MSVLISIAVRTGIRLAIIAAISAVLIVVLTVTAGIVAALIEATLIEATLIESIAIRSSLSVLTPAFLPVLPTLVIRLALERVLIGIPPLLRAVKVASLLTAAVPIVFGISIVVLPSMRILSFRFIAREAAVLVAILVVTASGQPAAPKIAVSSGIGLLCHENLLMELN
jgi:hypothetical protein